MSLASLREAICSIERFVSVLELNAVSCKDAADLVEVFIKGERLCHVGKTMSATRAAEGSVHLQDGYKDASSWLADKEGEPVQKARAELETASKLTWLEETDRAFRAGELSSRQVENIADAASADPRAEKDLLEKARTGSLRELKDQCEKVKAAALSKEEDEARYERIRRERYLRVWKGSDGATKGQFSLTPDAGARLLARLEPWADRFFDEARRSGKRESNEAYMADALLSCVTGVGPQDGSGEPSVLEGGDSDDSDTGSPLRDDGTARSKTAAGPFPRTGRLPGAEKDKRRGPPPATVILRVDLSALRRGELVRGETCEIAGVGPVPLSVAREILPDCLLKLVITKGVDVRTIAHHGRTLTSHQRTALQYRDPYCVVPGCGRSFGLENDHIEEYHLGGPTSLDNLCRLCALHHYLKTHRGYKIRGKPGAWEWVAPARGHEPTVPS